MADNISECPFCNGQFRVPANGASDRMLCPHCRQVVDLRRLSAGTEASPSHVTNPPPRPSSPDIDAIVADCPSCSGKFQVLVSMLGQSVACPHCRAHLQVPAPPSAGPTASDFKIQIVGSSPAPTQPPVPNIEEQFPKPKCKTAGSKPGTKSLPKIITVGDIRATADASMADKSPNANGEQIDSAKESITTIARTGLDPELEKLLPPKFVVAGSLQRVAKTLGASHVILPDGARRVSGCGHLDSPSSLCRSNRRHRQYSRVAQTPSSNDSLDHLIYCVHCNLVRSVLSIEPLTTGVTCPFGVARRRVRLI